MRERAIGRGEGATNAKNALFATKLTISPSIGSRNARKSTSPPAIPPFLSSRTARVAAPARRTAVDCAPLSRESLPLFSKSRGLSEKRRGLSTSYLPQCLFVSRIYANFDATSSHSCAHEIRFRLPLCFPTCRRDSLHARRICGPPRPSRRSPLRASLRALRQRRNRPVATSLRLGSPCARRAVSQRRRALHHAPRRGGHDHRRRLHDGRQFGGGRLLARRGGGHAHEH